MDGAEQLEMKTHFKSVGSSESPTSPVSSQRMFGTVLLIVLVSF